MCARVVDATDGDNTESHWRCDAKTSMRKVFLQKSLQSRQKIYRGYNLFPNGVMSLPLPCLAGQGGDRRRRRREIELSDTLSQ